MLCKSAFGLRMSNLCFWKSTEIRMLHYRTLVFGLRKSDFGLQKSDCWSRTSDVGYKSLMLGVRKSDVWLRKSVFGGTEV